MTTEALIDGDILAYRCAARAQETYEPTTPDEEPLVIADWKACKEDIDETINDFMKITGCSKYVMYLSPPDRSNWRFDVLPTYKLNRSDKAAAKPQLLARAAEYLMTDHDGRWEDNLEADDLMGMHATRPKFRGVIVSEDKDFLTIPAPLYRPHHPEDGIKARSKYQADMFHILQGIMGDRVDGYTGCPGVGEVKGRDILKQWASGSGYKWVRNPKGKWVKDDCDDLWEIICSWYARKGWEPDEALTQFQVARILRYGEFNLKDGVKLWQPTDITQVKRS